MQEAGSAPLKPLNLGRSLVDADAEDSDDDSEARRPAACRDLWLFTAETAVHSRSEPPAEPAAMNLQQQCFRLTAPHSHPGC